MTTSLIHIERPVSVVSLTLEEIVILACYRRGVIPTMRELRLLTVLLKLNKDVKLDFFCKTVAISSLYESAQCVRNVVNKFTKLGMIEKKGRGNKLIKFK